MPSGMGLLPRPLSVRWKTYEAFEAAVIADYDAETAVQRELVLRLASILWRLRRSTSIESALFEAMAGERPSPASLNPAVVKVIAISRRANRLPSESQYSAENALEEFVCAPDDLAKAFIRLTAHGTFPLDRLSRYEHMLWRQARQLVFTLESLRRRQQAPRRFRFPFSVSSPERA